MDGQAPATGEYVLDEQVGYLLRLANQRHTALFQQLALDGVTPTQWAALVRLAEHGALSQNHLGRLAAMDVTTIKGVVDRLRKRGLVRSAPDPEDGRRMLITLAPEGAALVARMQASAPAISAATLAPLSRAERRTVLQLLAKMAL